MSNTFQTPIDALLSRGRYSEAGKELLVPAELYLEPDFGGLEQQEQNRRKLEKLTEEKTRLIQQLLKGNAGGNPRIEAIDRELLQTFERAKFWPKGIGGVVEGNPWYDKTQGVWKKAIRVGDLAEKKRIEEARHEEELVKISKSTDGHAQAARIRTENTENELRLIAIEREVTMEHRAPLIGAVIDDRYEVLDFIGAGGSGHCWRARDMKSENDNEVCIKVFPLKNLEAKKDFEALALMKRTLQPHKNICNVVHVTEPGQPGHIIIFDKYPDGHKEKRVHSTLHYIATELGKGEIYLYTHSVKERMYNQQKGLQKFKDKYARRLFRQALEGFNYLHTHEDGYTHGDVKDDNLVIGRVDQFYEVKLMDFGLLEPLGKNGLDPGHVTRESVKKGSNRSVPEMLGNADSMDGRKVDMYRLGWVLNRLTEGDSVVNRDGLYNKMKSKGPGKQSLDQLLGTLMAEDPCERPLAGDLLDQATARDFGGDWLYEEMATESELIDEVESRMFSIDLLHDKYTNEISIPSLIAAGAEHVQAEHVFQTVLQALKESGRVKQLHPSHDAATSQPITCVYASEITARIVISDEELHTGETLRLFLREHCGSGSLLYRTEQNHDKRISIPDGPFQEGKTIKVDVGEIDFQQIHDIDFVKKVKEAVDAVDATAWANRPRRTLITIKSTYLSGCNAAAYEELLGIVSSALQQYTNAALHREAVIIRAFALLKWLRMIVCSAYVYHQNQVGEFENNLIPVFICKLGELLAALSLHDEMEGVTRLSGPIHRALSDPPTINASMQLSADMIRQMGGKFQHALYSGPKHFALVHEHKQPARSGFHASIFQALSRIRATQSPDDNPNYYYDFEGSEGGLRHAFQLRSSSSPTDPTCLRPSPLRERLINLHNALIDLIDELVRVQAALAEFVSEEKERFKTTNGARLLDNSGFLSKLPEDEDALRKAECPDQKTRSQQIDARNRTL